MAEYTIESAWQGVAAADDFPIGVITKAGRIVDFRVGVGVAATGGDKKAICKLQKSITDLLSSDLDLDNSMSDKTSAQGTLNTDTTIDVALGDVLTSVITLSGSTGDYPYDMTFNVRIQTDGG